jgi:hypothetical protein
MTMTRGRVDYVEAKLLLKLWIEAYTPSGTVLGWLHCDMLERVWTQSF